jgi:hypothetical protein
LGLHALGLTSRALSLTPEFFTDTTVDLLIRAGLQTEKWNDESLGRALERWYEAGVTAVLACVAAHALQVCGLQHRVVPLASSRVSLRGE